MQSLHHILEVLAKLRLGYKNTSAKRERSLLRLSSILALCAFILLSLPADALASDFFTTEPQLSNPMGSTPQLGGLGGRHAVSLSLNYGRNANAQIKDPYAEQRGTFDGATSLPDDSYDFGGAYNLRVDAAVLVSRFHYGGYYGFESSFQLGVPFKGYYSGIRLGLGVHLHLLKLGPLYARLGLGLSMGSDRHAYIHPRVGIMIGNMASVEAGFYYVHQQASWRWGHGGPFRRGLGHHRLHIDYFHTLPGDASDDLFRGLHLYFERSILEADLRTLVRHRATDSPVYTFGIGYAF